MFSDILVELAQSRGVTMYELSQKTNIPQSLLSNYKNGKKKPALENIIKLADFFDVSTDYLLGRTDNPNVSGNNIIQSSNVINGNNGNHSPLTVTETEKENNCKEIEVLLEKMPRSKQLRAIADIIDLLEEKYQEE